MGCALPIQASNVHPDREAVERIGMIVTLVVAMAAGFHFINARRRVVPPPAVARGKVISDKQSRGTQTEVAKKAKKNKKVQSQCTYTAVGPHPEVKSRYDVLRRGEDGAWSD